MILNFFQSMTDYQKKTKTDFMDQFNEPIRNFLLEFLVSYEEDIEEMQGGLSLYQ